jgi:peptide methionine sulfoxide reductase msrA/msrB
MRMRLLRLLPFMAFVACAPAMQGTGTAEAPKTKDETPVNPRYSKSAYDVTPLAKEKAEELAKKLGPEGYEVTRHAATERAFCGALTDLEKEGFYACAVCGLPVYKSGAKFHSGSGWPSFFQPFDPDHVKELRDESHGMERVEIRCARCDSHLGHVFDDGPKPTGLRYCMNSIALKFYGKDDPLPAESQPVKTETAYFAGGCFWGVEHWFQKGPGVVDAVSGYMQGHVDHPTYEQVCTDTTGHAETVKVVFDPARISYERLLQAFFVMHDPTQADGQGPDLGEQYRSGIWTTSAAQQKSAEQFIAKLTAEKKFGGRKIVTKVEPARTFWEAEEYHQDYVEKTGRACHVTNPWKTTTTEKSGASH